MSAADFDRFVAIAFWASLGLLTLALALMVWSLVLHRRRVAHRERRDGIVRAWRELFVRALDGDVAGVPRLDPAEAFVVLATWNDAYEARAGIAPVGARSLQHVARTAGLDALALGYAERGDVAEKIVGATALGHLGDARATDRLRELAADEDGQVSFAAAAALLMIDPTSAKHFVEQLARRRDWVATRVERVVRGSAALIGHELVAAVVRGRGEERVRLLRYAGMLDADLTRAAVMAPLYGEADAETVAASLRTLRGIVEPSDLPLLKRYANDASSGVRVQAVNALNSLDGPEVDELLVARLHDPNAWVRQRAAEALATRHEDRRALLERVSSDPFAYQILRYAFDDAAREGR